MRRYRLGGLAQRDLLEILTHSQAAFGMEGRKRYQALITLAIRDVAEDPERIGSRRRDELAPDARTYHLLHSRDRIAPEIGRVARPRHFLVYRPIEAGRIEIGRILHERMELAHHLPDTYRAG
jgi:toxin ParE1/3/4